MKKSTLITTIAMIVVVVVALSTATYAWFTSASKATASASISVVSSSGWLLATPTSKTIVESTEDLSYDPETNPVGRETVAFDMSFTSPIVLNLLNGLYSPAGLLTGAITESNGSAKFDNAQWFTAQQRGNEIASSATVAEPETYKIYKATSEATPETPTSYIKVKNSSSGAKSLRLTITVFVEDSVYSNSSQKAATEKLCAYISYYDGTNSKVAHTAYNYGTVTDTTAARTPVPASTATGNKVVLNGDTTWTVCDTNTKLLTAFTGEEDKTDGNYYQYYLDIADIARDGEVDFSLNIWFDGWNIFSEANGAQAKVYLAFGDVPVVVGP